jgi:predicted nucleic acid-binding protein
MLRLVLDTSVVVAALDSPTGASRALVMAVLQGRCHLLLSTGLILEYEAVLTRSSMLEMIGIGADEVGRLLDRLAGQCVPVRVDWQWRPVAHDSGDDVVVATAINGQEMPSRHSTFATCGLVQHGSLSRWKDRHWC